MKPQRAFKMTIRCWDKISRVWVSPISIHFKNGSPTWILTHAGVFEASRFDLKLEEKESSSVENSQ